MTESIINKTRGRREFKLHTPSNFDKFARGTVPEELARGATLFDWEIDISYVSRNGAISKIKRVPDYYNANKILADSLRTFCREKRRAERKYDVMKRLPALAIFDKLVCAAITDAMLLRKPLKIFSSVRSHILGLCVTYLNRCRISGTRKHPAT